MAARPDVLTRTIPQLPMAAAVTEDAFVPVQAADGPAMRLRIGDLFRQIAAFEHFEETRAALPASTGSGAVAVVYADPAAGNNGYWRDTADGWVLFELLGPALKADLDAVIAAAEATFEEQANAVFTARLQAQQAAVAAGEALPAVQQAAAEALLRFAAFQNSEWEGSALSVPTYAALLAATNVTPLNAFAIVRDDETKSGRATFYMRIAPSAQWPDGWRFLTYADRPVFTLSMFGGRGDYRPGTRTGTDQRAAWDLFNAARLAVGSNRTVLEVDEAFYFDTSATGLTVANNGDPFGHAAMPEYATAAAMIADKANIANGTRVRVLTDERLPASNPAEHRTSIYTKTNGTAATALSPADFTWSQLPGSNAKMPMLTIRGPGSLRGHRLQAADLGGPGFYFNGPGDEANIESWGAGHLHLVDLTMARVDDLTQAGARGSYFVATGLTTFSSTRCAYWTYQQGPCKHRPFRMGSLSATTPAHIPGARTVARPDGVPDHTNSKYCANQGYINLLTHNWYNGVAASVAGVFCNGGVMMGDTVWLNCGSNAPVGQRCTLFEIYGDNQKSTDWKIMACLVEVKDHTDYAVRLSRASSIIMHGNSAFDKGAQYINFVRIEPDCDKIMVHGAFNAGRAGYIDDPAGIAVYHPADYADTGQMGAYRVRTGSNARPFDIDFLRIGAGGRDSLRWEPDVAVSASGTIALFKRLSAAKA